MSNPVIDVEALGKRYVLAHPRDRLARRRRRLSEELSNALSLSWLDRSETLPTRATREEFWALRNVCFQVRSGEVVGIIGRNGAGKSTLLKVLSRITEPTQGRVTLDGRVASLLEVGTGFHPELTGRENIFLNGAVLGMRKQEITRKFDEIVSFAEVERFLDTPVKRYSSGMYLRLAFAVAAHLEPEILIVDEVLAVGDYAFQNKCLNKMQDVSSTGRTVLFVSHNMAAIHRLCSRSILLSQGRVAADGPTNEVIQAYVSQGASERPDVRQPAMPSKPIHLRRATLRDSAGRPASEFRYDEGLCITVEYEVNEPIAGCNVWLSLRTADEVQVLETADTDLDSTRFEKRSAGYYTAQVVIPPKWLNVGRYSVSVGIQQGAYRITHARMELGSFTVLDVGTAQRGRRGVLQPLLPWTSQLAEP